MSHVPDTGKARCRFVWLIDQLYRARAERGPLSMAEESECAGELEDLWRQLTWAEQKEMEAIVEKYKHPSRH